MKTKLTVLPIDRTKLHSLLWRYDINQNEIAKLLNVSQQAISKSLRGNLPSLLPKIELAIKKIISGNK